MIMGMVSLAMAEIFKNEIIIFECCTGRKYPPNFFQVTQNKQKTCCQVKSFFTSPQKIDLFERAANTSVKVKVERII